VPDQPDIPAVSKGGGLIGRAIDSLIDSLWPATSPAAGADGEVAWWERPARIIFTVYLLVGLPIALNRVIQGAGTDFNRFYGSARYLLDHGARHPRSEWAHYLPSVDVPWVVLTVLPLPVAVVVFYVLGCWSWIGLLGTVQRKLLAGVTLTFQRRAVVLAGLMVVPLAVDGLCLGSFHTFMVWLMVAGLLRVAEGRTRSGGLLLGLGAWLKLLPLLGVGYLLLKRKWLPAAIALATVMALDVGLSLIAYGPRAAWEEHVEWWCDEGSGALARELGVREPIDEDRRTNQSLPVILRRVLTSFGMEPDSPRNAVALGDLSPAQLRVVYFSVVGALGLALAYFCRRPGSVLTQRQWATEIALICLGTLWLSPVLWSYHPTAATPGLALVLGQYPQHRRLAWATGLAWVLAMALFAWPLARVLGHVLWASMLIGAALVWMERSTGLGQRPMWASDSYS
jgi:hypothetical protein